MDREAEETPFSQLTYDEKRKYFIDGEVPPLAGLEYYVGGVFDGWFDPDAAFRPVAYSSLVNGFDRRNQHGQSWITSIKDQGATCASCWSFASVWALEWVVNVYYNQHLNLNLSEQDTLSCTAGGNNCEVGGLPSDALVRIQNYGVVDEACFSYQGADLACSAKCSIPSDLIKITWKIDASWSNRLYYPQSEYEVKRMLIEHGPITAGLGNFRHVMVLVGYEKDLQDGRTIWIFKNSWGLGHGEDGYVRAKTEIENMRWTHAIQAPLSSESNYQIQCTDADQDGYCNWGISEQMPSSCVALSCKVQKDCNDADATQWMYKSDYSCEEIKIEIVIPDPIDEEVIEEDIPVDPEPIDVSISSQITYPQNNMVFYNGKNDGFTAKVKVEQEGYEVYEIWSVEFNIYRTLTNAWSNPQDEDSLDYQHYQTIYGQYFRTEGWTPGEYLIKAVVRDSMWNVIHSSQWVSFEIKQVQQVTTWIVADTCSIDLVLGTHTCYDIAEMTFLQVADAKALLKLNLAPRNWKKWRAIFDVQFLGSDPSQWKRNAAETWLVNVGDSSSNNGRAGDGGTQSNDSELQIANTSFNVYASDYGGSTLLFQKKDIFNSSSQNSAGYRLKFSVSNNQIERYGGEVYPDLFSSPYIFALNGQYDSSGPTNYDIYAAFNRTIASSYRDGAGVSTVDIKIIYE